MPENTEVTLQCTIDANPAASDIQIRRNDEVVYSSRDSNRSSNDLGRVTASGPNRVSYTFSASSNWKGKLRCYGVNTAGSKQQSVDFLVQSMSLYVSLDIITVNVRERALGACLFRGNVISPRGPNDRPCAVIRAESVMV